MGIEKDIKDLKGMVKQLDDKFDYYLVGKIKESKKEVVKEEPKIETEEIIKDILIGDDVRELCSLCLGHIKLQSNCPLCKGSGYK